MKTENEKTKNENENEIEKMRSAGPNIFSWKSNTDNIMAAN